MRVRRLMRTECMRSRRLFASGRGLVNSRQGRRIRTARSWEPRSATASCSRKRVGEREHDAVAGLMAAKSFHADIKFLALNGAEHPVVGPELQGYLNTFNDLLGTVVADVAGEAAKICSGVVYGFGAASADDKAAFAALRNALDEALAGTRLAKDRAAKTLTTIMIPEALDYPL